MDSSPSKFRGIDQESIHLQQEPKSPSYEEKKQIQASIRNLEGKIIDAQMKFEDALDDRESATIDEVWTARRQQELSNTTRDIAKQLEKLHEKLGEPKPEPKSDHPHRLNEKHQTLR